jgi:hypothetical protein
MTLRFGFNVDKDTPVYTQNCLGTKPCMTFTASADGGNGQTLLTNSTGTMAATQPVGHSVVASRTANFAIGQILVSATSSTETQVTFASSANTIQMYGGGVFTATAADSTFHAINATSCRRPRMAIALEINLSLWIMIACAAVETSRLIQYLS